MGYAGMALRAASASAMLFACLGAQAGINAATPLGPEGGPVLKVEFHPTDPSIAYMATVSGFHRSIDGGRSWRPSVLRNYVSDFAIDPQDGNHLYIAEVNSGHLYESRDAGATSTPVTTLPLTPAGPSSVEISRNGVIYVVRGNRMFRSSDGAATWSERTALGTDYSSNSLYVDPLDSDKLYARFGMTDIRSSDGGNSWQPMTLPAATSHLLVAATTPRLLFASSNTGLWVSSNDGTNWSLTGITDYVNTIAMDPTDTQVLYAGVSGHGLLRSRNQGGSWTPLTTHPQMGSISSIAINPSQPATLLAGGSGGVGRSIDSGDSFSPANAGFVGSAVEKIVPVNGSRRVYLSTYASGIFVLDVDTGAVNPVNLMALAGINPYGPRLESFDLLAQGVGGDRLFVGMNGGFARSSDGGQQWQWISSPGTGAVTRLASSISQPQVIVASAGRGLHRSTDGGTVWNPVNGLPAYSEAGLIEFAASSSVVYAHIWRHPPPYDQVLQEGIYKSINGGIDWEPAHEGLPSGHATALAVDPADDRIAYVGVGTGFFKTVDGGRTWTPLTWYAGSPEYATVNNISIDPERPNIVYATRNGHVGRSVDGGQIWEHIDTAVPALAQSGRVQVNPFKDHTVFTSTYGRGMQEVTLATDLEVEAPAPLAPMPHSTPIVRRFTVHNIGPFHATDVETIFDLPPSASDVSVSATAGTCEVRPRSIVCRQPVLLAGRGTDISVRASYSGSDSGRITATASPSESDLSEGNNVAEHTVMVRQEANVAVTANAPAQLVRTETLAYSFVASNTGPHAASEVSASIRLAAGLSLVTATSSRGTCTASTDTVTCALGDLTVNATATINLTTNAATAGTYETRIQVGSTDFDPEQANNSASVSSNLTDPAPPPGAGSGDSGGGSSGGGSGGSGGSGGGSGGSGSGGSGGNSSGSNGTTTGGGGGGGSLDWWLLTMLAGAITARRTRRLTKPDTLQRSEF